MYNTAIMIVGHTHLHRPLPLSAELGLKNSPRLRTMRATIPSNRGELIQGTHLSEPSKPETSAELSRSLALRIQLKRKVHPWYALEV